MIDLILGDCLEVMGGINDNSVDAIICDLPYGTVNWKSPQSWDKVIPMDSLWSSYWRILKADGCVLLFGNEPFSTMVRSSFLSRYKYDLYWIKTRKGGFANAKVKPLKSVETISVFSRSTTSPGRSGNMKYNPQGLIRIDKTVKNGGKSRLGMTVRKNSMAEYVQEFTGYPDDVLNFESEKKGFHPTQKPVPLMEYLVKTYTNEGDTVLDNCMGSGTTGVACKNLGRSFIGIERDEGYFLKAKERIENA